MEVVRQYLDSLQRKGGPYEHNLSYIMKQMQVELEKQQEAWNQNDDYQQTESKESSEDDEEDEDDQDYVELDTDMTIEELQNQFTQASICEADIQKWLLTYGQSISQHDLQKYLPQIKEYAASLVLTKEYAASLVSTQLSELQNERLK